MNNFKENVWSLLHFMLWNGSGKPIQRVICSGCEQRVFRLYFCWTRGKLLEALKVLLQRFGLKNIPKNGFYVTIYHIETELRKADRAFGINCYIKQLTPTVRSAFLSSVSSSLSICWSEPNKFWYFWFVYWPLLELIFLTINETTFLAASYIFSFSLPALIT